MSTASEIVGDKVKSNSIVDSYKRLRKVDRPSGQRYSVVAYMVCQQGEDPNQPVAFVINLGNYATPKEASDRATDLIEITGYKGICAGPSNQWFDISESNTINRTKYVATESCPKETILRQQQQRRALEEERRRKERERVEKEIAEEQERSTDPTTIEAYTYNWYALVKNRALIEYHEQERDKAIKAYEQRVSSVQEQYKANPRHDDEFLSVLKEKLILRKEEHVYDAIEKGHKELREKVLDLSDGDEADTRLSI